MLTISQRLMPSAAALALAALSLFSGLFSTASAASINYGDFNAPAVGTPIVMFTQVTESSQTDPVPLYGPPTAFAVGLDFTPTGFSATSIGGGADLTDGQLNAGVMALGGNVIPAISLSESGTFSLSGIGTAATQVAAGASLRVKITEIDGVDVADIWVPQANDSENFNLVTDAGLAQPWQVSLLVDVEGYLISQMVPFVNGATKVEIVIDNALVAISEPTSVATIIKTDFDVTIVPEPASLALVGVALCCGLVASRKRA